MFYVAKLIEALGVCWVSYGLLLGLTQENALRTEMKLMVVGAIVFYFGRFLERRASV
jgi:hypothetical protein